MGTDQHEYQHPQIGRDIEAQAGGRPRGGTGSVYCCPECGGVLWQIDEGGGDTYGGADDSPAVTCFACHTGHTYAPELLLRLKSEALEAALYAAARMLAEKATLCRQLSAARLGEADRDEKARIEALARLDEKHLRLIKGVLLEAYPSPTDQARLTQEALEDGEGHRP